MSHIGILYKYAYWWYEYTFDSEISISMQSDIDMRSSPNIETFELLSDDPEYILNSLPYCHNINKENKPYTIEECIEMDYIPGAYYLSFYTDEQIINILGSPGEFFNNKKDRLSLLRSYFPDMVYNGSVNIPETLDYNIDEKRRQEYVRLAQPCWKNVNLDKLTKEIIHISWNEFYNSLAYCMLVANFYAGCYNLKPIPFTYYIQRYHKNLSLSVSLTNIHKSVNWITNLIKDLLMKPEELGIKYNGNFYIFSDDAVYSGSQFSNNIDEILKYIDYLNPNMIGSTYQIGIFMPYMSKLAMDKLKNNQNIRKYSIFYVNNFFEANTNIYFDHKIADYLSVNTRLIHGYLNPDDDDEENDNTYCDSKFFYPYIKHCENVEDSDIECLHPPYKPKFDTQINFDSVINVSKYPEQLSKYNYPE